MRLRITRNTFRGISNHHLWQLAAMRIASWVRLCPLVAVWGCRRAVAGRGFFSKPSIFSVRTPQTDGPNVLVNEPAVVTLARMLLFVGQQLNAHFLSHSVDAVAELDGLHFTGRKPSTSTGDGMLVAYQISSPSRLTQLRGYWTHDQYIISSRTS